MKYDDIVVEVIAQDMSASARIARQLAEQIAHDFVPQDWDKAAQRAVSNFSAKLQREMQTEFNRLKMQAVK